MASVGSQDDDRESVSPMIGSAAAQDPLVRVMAPRSPLLDTANPARLSRTEFRICLLLSQGLNLTSISTELGISASTLKAHIRRILLKTRAQSFAELLARLLGPAGRDPRPSERWTPGRGS